MMIKYEVQLKGGGCINVTAKSMNVDTNEYVFFNEDDSVSYRFPFFNTLYVKRIK